MGGIVSYLPIYLRFFGLFSFKIVPDAVIVVWGGMCVGRGGISTPGPIGLNVLRNLQTALSDGIGVSVVDSDLYGFASACYVSSCMEALRSGIMCEGDYITSFFAASLRYKGLIATGMR